MVKAKKKAGRPEERLVFQDPGAALDRLFTAKPKPKKKAKRGKKKG
jgi:hypothetical protein